MVYFVKRFFSFVVENTKMSFRSGSRDSRFIEKLAELRSSSALFLEEHRLSNTPTKVLTQYAVNLIFHSTFPIFAAACSVSHYKSPFFP